MNVTFLNDYQGPETGNELYRRGDKVTLERCAHLIAAGVVVEGWQTLDDVPVVDDAPVLDTPGPVRKRRKKVTE